MTAARDYQRSRVYAWEQAEVAPYGRSLPDALPCWCLLHELAHAMAATHEGESDLHGPRFMGLYLRLLLRYLRLPEAALLASLRAAGIDVDPDAAPPFLDPPQEQRMR